MHRLPSVAGMAPIQRGEHTLILAPTGSGKTLAAFLWGIDQLFRTLADEQRRLMTSQACASSTFRR